MAYTDQELGRLWTWLEQDEQHANRVIAVTSDHGEEFGEHGQIGHNQLFGESLHVPLILRLPEGDALAGRRVTGRAGLIDLHELLLGYADAPNGTGAGRLMTMARGEEQAELAHHAMLTDRPHKGPSSPLQRAVRLGDRALLERHQGESATRSAFDLDSDPGERLPLPQPYSDLERLLKTHFADQEVLRREWIEGEPNQASSPTGEATKRQLRALGYLDDGDGR